MAGGLELGELLFALGDLQYGGALAWGGLALGEFCSLS